MAAAVCRYAEIKAAAPTWRYWDDLTVTASTTVGGSYKKLTYGHHRCSTGTTVAACEAGAWSYFQDVQVQEIPTPCTPAPPPEDECQAGAWGLVEGRGETVESVFADSTGSTSFCWGSCKVSIEELGPRMNEECSGGSCTWWYVGKATQSGEQCNTATDPDVPSPDPVLPEDAMSPEDYGESCATSSNGVEYCTSTDSQQNQHNCGYVNDEFMCLDSIQNDNCHVTASGQRMCGSNAKPPTVPTAPAPAPPTQPATPTDTVQSTTGNTYNYYNSTVVGSSQRPPTSDGSNPTTGTPGSSGTGDGSGTGHEGESAGGGGDCSAPPTCSGDPILCAVLAQQWRSRCVPDVTESQLQSEFGPKDDGEGKWFATEERDLEDLSSSGWLSGSCLDDYTLNMGSLLGTYTIPFSELCELLQFVGMFVMVSAYVGSARIIVGVL